MGTKQDEDITDVLLENKLLFEQLNELKSSERQHLNDRKTVEDLLEDECKELRDKPYQEIVVHLLNGYHTKQTDCEKALSKAIEKEGEVITLKAKLNSVQQHSRIERNKLEEELQRFKDKAKHEKDRQNLSTNEQISLLIQERDSSQANELALAERVGELMEEIVKLNEDVSKVKQQKLDLSLTGDTLAEEVQQLRREFTRSSEEDGRVIDNLHTELTKRNDRIKELEEEVGYLQQRCELQRQELQTNGDSSGSQQIELFQYKAKVKDLQHQIVTLNRQVETLQASNATLTSDNEILAEKFVDLKEQLAAKELEVREGQRDFTYKIQGLEKAVELAKEKHHTIEERLRREVEQMKLDKHDMLCQLTSDSDTAIDSVQTLFKRQDEQRRDQEGRLHQQITTLSARVEASENSLDRKMGEIELLHHQIEEQKNMVALVTSKLECNRRTSAHSQEQLAEMQRSTEILERTNGELRAEMTEVRLELEFSQNQDSRCRDLLRKLEVFNGSEVRTLPTNLTLMDSLEKLKDYVEESNQTLRNNRRMIDKIGSETKINTDEAKQLKQRLEVSENENLTLASQLTASSAHLESSHKEIRQLREIILKNEKSKRILERRLKAIEAALLEMEYFVQAVKVKDIDSEKVKEAHRNLQKLVKDLIECPDPAGSGVEVELVVEELLVLRDEVVRMREECLTLRGERNTATKKLQHEQHWVDKLRQKEDSLTNVLDEKNSQLSSVKHELQLKERLLSDKERTFQIRKRELEEEVKKLKRAQQIAMSGESCGHTSLVTDYENLRQQLEVARNTVVYKEQELSKTQSEIKTLEEKLKNSNTEKLHDEILRLNIANAKFQAQLTSMSGEEEEVNQAEERNNLLNVINQSKIDLEEVNRKLYQADLKAETLVSAIDELKAQREVEREKYKKDLSDFHERVTMQKEQLNRTTTELETVNKKYLETKKQKSPHHHHHNRNHVTSPRDHVTTTPCDHVTTSPRVLPRELAEEESIRLGERVNQLRESTTTEGDKLGRLEKELDRKSEIITTLTEKYRSSEAKVHELESQVAQLQRTILSLEQTKTTLQLKYADISQKYDREKDHFENVKQKLKSRAKNYKLHYEKENSALTNKSALLEEEAALLKMTVTKEESWRKTTEQAYTEWRTRSREIETSKAALEDELRMMKSELHAVKCTLSTRQEEINALTAELHHTSRAQQHYERIYRTLEAKSRAETALALTLPSQPQMNITSPITTPRGGPMTSTPLGARLSPPHAVPTNPPHDVRVSPRRGDSPHGPSPLLQTPMTSGRQSPIVVDSEFKPGSPRSQLSLEQEGLILDDPDRPVVTSFKHSLRPLMESLIEKRLESLVRNSVTCLPDDAEVSFTASSSSSPRGGNTTPTQHFSPSQSVNEQS